VQLCPAMNVLATLDFHRSLHCGEQAPAPLVRAMALRDAHVIMILNVAVFAHKLSTDTRARPQLAASSSRGNSSASHPRSSRQ